MWGSGLGAELDESLRHPTSKSFLRQTLLACSGEFLRPDCDCPKSAAQLPSRALPQAAQHPWVLSLLQQTCSPVGTAGARDAVGISSHSDECATGKHDLVLIYKSRMQGKPGSSTFRACLAHLYSLQFPQHYSDPWTRGPQGPASPFFKKTPQISLFPSDPPRLTQLTASGPSSCSSAEQQRNTTSTHSPFL